MGFSEIFSYFCLSVFTIIFTILPLVFVKSSFCLTGFFGYFTLLLTINVLSLSSRASTTVSLNLALQNNQKYTFCYFNSPPF
jgi:hypothetical protein